MLSKVNRLCKNKHFNFVYRKGQKCFSKNLYVVWVFTKFNENKIGFSVNNKIGNAVCRNKVKRRLRFIVRELMPTLKPKVNFVIVAKKGIELLSFAELKREVVWVLGKAGVLLDEKTS